MQASGGPEQALQLLGVLTAHWQSMLKSKMWPVQLLTGSTSLQAAQCLPYTLHAMLQRREWHQAAESVAHRLIRVLSSLRDQRQQNGTMLQSVAACVLALKDTLPDDGWEHMPLVLTILS